MIVETPAALVAALEAEAAGIQVSLQRQIQALKELHGLFTSGRSGLRSMAYLDVPRLRNAYLRYHLPLNAARASCVLAQLSRVHPRLCELEEVVDLGSGPGSASLATLHVLYNPPRSFLLQDRSRAALAVARRLMEKTAEGGRFSGFRLSTRIGSLPDLPSLPRRALVWLSMVLNELEVGSRRGPDPAAILSRLERALDPPSVIIVMEPALRAPSRNLLRIHDAALSAGCWRIIAPCTHQQACPLLRERDRPWCHFHFQWLAPAVVTEVVDPLELDHQVPSFSFLALERVSGRDEGSPADPRRARAIGDRMRVGTRKRGIYICREGQRELVEDAPQDMRRGDVVTLQEDGSVRVDLPWTPQAPQSPP